MIPSLVAQVAGFVLDKGSVWSKPRCRVHTALLCEVAYLPVSNQPAER